MSDGIQYWNTQVDFFDKVKNKRVTGTAKVYMQGEEKFRMEVMDPFGFVKIGTVIINQGQAKVNFMNRKPYEGPVYDGMLQQMIKTNVSMRDFVSLFTQTNISEEEWACQSKDGRTLSECSNQREQLLIKWTGVMTNPGTSCRVTHPRANIALKVKSYKFYDEAKDKLFVL